MSSGLSYSEVLAAARRIRGAMASILGKVFTDFLKEVPARLHSPLENVWKHEVIYTLRVADPEEIFGYYGVRGELPDEEDVRVLAAIWLTRPIYIIKDDFVDRDAEREGRKTSWRIMEDEYGKKGVLATQYLPDIFWALLLEYMDTLTPRHRDMLSRYIVGGMRDVTCGQMLDVLHRSLNEAEFLEMYVLKSSRCPVCARLVIGGDVAGAEEEVLDGYRRVSSAMGLLYMLADDAQDVTVDKERGRPNIFLQYGEKSAEELVRQAVRKINSVLDELPVHSATKEFIRAKVGHALSSFPRLLL